MPPEQLLSDTLAAAYLDHVPSLEERKAAAALWVTAAMTAESGGRLSDAFVISDLGDRLRDLAAAYPSVNACAGTAPDTSASGSSSVASALSSCEEFACDTSCWPDASVFGPAAGPALTLLKKVGATLKAPAPPTGEQPPDWNSFYLKLHNATLDLVFDSRGGVKSMSKRIGDAMVNGLSEDDVKTIEKGVSTVVSSTESLAKAAAKAGVANAVLIAEVCSGLEAALLAKKLADGLEPARQLVADCWLFKSRYCGDPPECTDPDPCAKQATCPSNLVRAPDGAVDLPFTPVACVDPSDPGSCSHPVRDGGPIERDGGARDGGVHDGGRLDAGSRDGGIDAVANPDSAYCTNAAGGGCAPNDPPVRSCDAAFGGGRAAYCCNPEAASTIGSNDCPFGQTHCGLLCQSIGEPCCNSQGTCVGGASLGGLYTGWYTPRTGGQEVLSFTVTGTTVTMDSPCTTTGSISGGTLDLGSCLGCSWTGSINSTRHAMGSYLCPGDPIQWNWYADNGQACPEGFVECGTGCIPGSAVCCE